jgi:hypothetical protein
MPLKTLHTDSPSLVPPRASTPTTTSLRLGTRALTRVSAMRPTDFCQPLFFPEPVPVLSVSDLASVRLSLFKAVRCDRRVRRFTTRWTRFGGPCGNEEGYWPSRAAPRLHPVALTLVVSLRTRHHL